MSAQADDILSITARAHPPHVWGQDLRCTLCRISTMTARVTQRDTKGLGPCPVAQALQRLANQ